MLASILLTLGALFLLYEEFRGMSLAAIAAALRAEEIRRVLAAIACTVVSFACLASYDAFAARVAVGNRISLARALTSGAASHAVSNFLGFHAVTGVAVRYRLFSQAGLGVADTARIISLSTAALALGFAMMLALALLAEPLVNEHAHTYALPAGAALIAALAGLLLWLSGGERKLSAFGFTLVLPSARLAAIQMIVGAIESTAAVGVLYVLLPPDLAPPFAVFAIAMILAVLLGVAGNTPGGLGVFDATIVALVGGHHRADIVSALLVYRAIYNLLPFVVGVVALGLFELHGAMRRPRTTPTGA